MFLAIKELQHAKFRYVMMGIIIILIAWLVFILSGLGNGLSTLSAATIKNLDANYVVYEKSAGATFNKSIISSNLIDEIKENKAVKDAAAFGSSMAAVSKEKTDDSHKKTDVALLGITLGSFIEPGVIEGKQLSPNEKFGVLANESLKDAGYKMGDELLVSNSNMKLTIIGFVENETFNHLPVLFTNMDTWRDYQYAAQGSDNGVTKPVQAITLKAPNLDSAMLDKEINGIETVTKSVAVNGMPGYKEETGTILMMLAFLIVISAFIISVFFYVITIQKTPQFGVMKAIGASNRFISKAIVAQVFILSFFGILVGAGLTYLTALAFPKEMPFDLDVNLVVLYAFALLIISLLSSLVSVRQITKIDPLTALGRVE
ncbi:ABC transporter permease [Neobacillus sp. MM2021_6]|uniref:ABC transporter permease n=1 Tax=Bacillaceae TaxID=186817 RepID=UPI00140BD49A|nr:MULTISPECIES: ABC transporter permease [Bacillaceae]MBO0962267.1 ABC transporter permease [Neobacillus sp. MM2021_6]NHC19416.1 ABC transporter permease [Bacillus sp. MM2020_4]